MATFTNNSNNGNNNTSSTSMNNITRPFGDDEEELHPIDAMHPCCVKEAKSRSKALKRREAFEKVDITRIALERRKVAKNLPTPSSSIERLHIHSEDCTSDCTMLYNEEEDVNDNNNNNMITNNSMKEYEKKLTKIGGYVRENDKDENSDDGSDTDSDLDAMLEGFETSNNIFEDNLEHIKNKRLAKLKLDVAENALKRERMKAIQGAPLKQIAEDDIGRILQNAERAICLIVEDGIIFEDRGERELQNLTQNEFVAKCIYDRMKAMAPHVLYTRFTYLTEPSASFASNFKLTSLPAIICIDYCNVIAQTKSIVEISNGSLNIRAIITAFDDWLDVVGMLKPKDGYHLSSSSSNNNNNNDDDEDVEDESLDVYECGVEGCHKHFQHEHIGMDGEGRDADTLNF